MGLSYLHLNEVFNGLISKIYQFASLNLTSWGGKVSSHFQYLIKDEKPYFSLAKEVCDCLLLISTDIRVPW